MTAQKVSLAAIIKELKLEVIYCPCDAAKVMIQRRDVNRPGLPLAGFFERFEADRIQIIGITESAYLKSMSDDERKKRIADFLAYHPPVIIYTHGNEVDPLLLEEAEMAGVPVLYTAESTSSFTSTLVAFLNLSLAPMEVHHGVLVEIYGEGVLITGDSGVGKSEAAIELIKRGHRLIADDAVELRKVSAKTIVGRAPELTKHYIELRGIGVVDVRRLFGMGAVKETEKVDLVVHFEPWDPDKFYERMGIDETYVDIMGNKIPSLTIPVKPGRNLAIIMEIAAMNNRQKRMGYNTAKELEEKIIKRAEQEAKELQ